MENKVKEKIDKLLLKQYSREKFKKELDKIGEFTIFNNRKIYKNIIYNSAEATIGDECIEIFFDFVSEDKTIVSNYVTILVKDKI